MAEFYINTYSAEVNGTEIGKLKEVLEGIESEIFSITNSISLGSESTIRIKERLKKAAECVEDEAQATELLSIKLLDIVSIYKKYEQAIINNVGGLTAGDDDTDSDTDNSNPEVIPDDGTDKSDEMSLQDAIDFLNEISLSTSIDGAVLAVIEYLIKLYDTAADTGILGTMGSAAGIIGLITGVAADIMYALDHGSTTNALLADLIVDVALWGIGEGAAALGTAVGTAVGGPIGTIVGKFVGGLVGNGVSIAMNVDWNGDAEGGVGKDAVSDWIDDQLDNIWGDAEIPAVI